MHCLWWQLFDLHLMCWLRLMPIPLWDTWCLLWEIGLVDCWYECVIDSFGSFTYFVCNILPWNPLKSSDFHNIFVDFTWVYCEIHGFQLNPQYLNLNLQYFTLDFADCAVSSPLGLKVVSRREIDSIACILFLKQLSISISIFL